jgi:hypothetical protein
MAETPEQRKMRLEMRKIDMYLEKLDDELLTYAVNKMNWILEKRSQEYMAECVKNNKEDKCF